MDNSQNDVFDKIKFYDSIRKAKRIAISGHVKPDGDCTGSTLALYGYLTENFNKDASKTIDAYIELMQTKFAFLKYSDRVITQSRYSDEPYDIFITLDCSNRERIFADASLFDNAGQTVVFDHHISNAGFSDLRDIRPDASSTAELLFDDMDVNLISKDVAEALYLGIIHDTGVFKHTNTTRHTMEVSGMLIEKGLNTEEIIDGSFYEKNYKENQILGRCLMESMLVADGKIIVSSISRKVMEFYGVTPENLDGVIDQLRITKGVEAAIFIHEVADQEYKVSMRSNGKVDVSKTAVFFGGGGHVKAAGCTMRGSLHDCINNLTVGICHQLDEYNSNN